MTDIHPKEMGYSLYPPRRSHEPGYSRIDVLFCHTPSERHFDPARMNLAVASPQRGLEQLSIQHPWHGSKNYRPVAGQVVLADTHMKKVEFFTFGGSLEIVTVEENELGSDDESRCSGGRTLAILKSPAPILPYYSDQNPGTLLAEEAEILLAERRAAWDHDPYQLDDRLELADPLSLYLACLYALTDTQRHPVSGFSEARQRYLHMLHREIDALSTMPGLSTHLPVLEEIL